MATFPHNLCGIRQDGHAEQHTPVVLRSEVERGMPRQRRTSADARVSVPCTLVFRSAAAAAEFEAWYYAEGFGWFDFTLPRTGAVVEARIVGGDIGGLTPITPAWNASERSITLEYIRPGFVQLPPGLHSVNPARVLSVQRNSTATYVDDAGLLQTAAANVARYQGGLMLVEDGAMNLLPAPEAFDSATWVKQATTVTPGLWDPAPNGVQYVADAVFETAATAQHDIYATGASAPGQSFSVFVKPVGRRYIGLYGYSGGYVCGQTFDLVAGVVGSPWASIEPVATILQPFAGGWWRIGMTSAVPMDIGAVIFCQTNAASIPPPYAGNPAAGAYLWGAMMNTGGLSSYTPVTRAADLITVAA